MKYLALVTTLVFFAALVAMHAIANVLRADQTRIHATLMDKDDCRRGVVFNGDFKVCASRKPSGSF